MDRRRPFMLGPWRVEPEAGRLVGDAGEAKLEPRTMDLLVHLAEHAGEVLSREALEQAVWQDMVVGYDALTNAVNKLRRTLGDDSRRPRLIETIPKRGYRLIAEVTAIAETGTRAVPPAGSPPGTARLRLVPAALGGGALLLILLVAASLWWPGTTLPPASSQPATTADDTAPHRIAVLPFANLDADDGYGHINEGITEDIITDLSRLAGLFVIAHQSSRRYLDSDLDSARIATELGVRYLLTGSIRTDHEWVRVNAQLVDSRRGGPVWAERFDYPLEDVFGLQDAVTRRIVDGLAVSLSAREDALLARHSTNNFAAYDAFRRGQRLFSNYIEEDNRQAQAAYQEAITLDPGYARPYGALASAMVMETFRRWSDNPVESLVRAEELARKAVELDDSPNSLWALAYVSLYRKNYREAVAAVERALQDDPNFGDGYGLLGMIHNTLGDAEEAERQIRLGMERNPFYTWDYAYNLGRALYTQGRYAEAVAHLEDALQRNPNAAFSRLILAACYVRLDRLEDAEWQITEALAADPSWDWNAVNRWVVYDDEAKAEAFRADLRRAGFPG